jgi:MerR family transcriptional regulator, light-induced transcriptional regulator
MTKSHLNTRPDNNIQNTSHQDSPATSFLQLCQEFASLDDGDGDTFGLSGEAIEMFRSDVVPKLMLVHSERLQEIASQQAITPADEVGFLNSLLSTSLSESASFLKQLRQRRQSSQAELLGFLGDTARRLGALWDEDEGSFTDVNIALCRLHHFLRDLSEEAGHHTPSFSSSGHQPSILFATAEGEQHIFGVMVVAEMFRSDHWAVSCSPGASTEELCTEIAETHFDVIGLSTSQTDLLPGLKSQCATLRAASRNSDVRIIIGGVAAELAKGDPTAVGADEIVCKGDNPTAIGRDLIRLTAHAC